MGKSAFRNTGFEKKLLFTKLLTETLGDYRYPINAVFDWSAPDRIFSAKWVNRSLTLSINLNTGKNTFFPNSPQGAALNVLFRAGFIQHFLRSLEAAEAAPSGGYFEGMAKLEAIWCRLTEKPFYGQLPSLKTAQPGLQLLDLQAACRAMNHMLMSYPEDIVLQDQDICNRYLNTLLDFSLLPEVCFSKGKQPRYLCTEGLQKLEHILKNHPEAAEQFSLLGSLRDLSTPLSLQTLNRSWTETGSPFFRDLLLRCCLLTGLSSDCPDYLREANAYREQALQWLETYRNTPYIFLQKNQAVIYRFLHQANQVCRDIICPTSGNLHIY